MLFTFNRFWKSLLFLIGAWICYGALGFEFTTITLLSIICMLQIGDNNFRF